MAPEENLRGSLILAMRREGYPADFAALVAREMNTDYLARRMIGYVNRVGLIPPEEFADEMLSILEERDRLRAKHLAEEAQGKINEMMENGLHPD
ncbi:MAG: hypothetical protein IKZ41_09420 [Clostridia bacterium]|nr:hypothetical protein [Clostridia bacterium]MBR5367137.1 hypothetical protein [Clostridia bacterium]